MSVDLVIPARCNPLAVARTEALVFQFAAGTWPEHLARLQRLGFRGAIVGGQGCGKTTLLGELPDRLRGLGVGSLAVRAARRGGTRRRELAAWLRTLQPADVLLLDSAEQLRRIDWWWLVRQTRVQRLGIVVTVHRRCCLPTWLECRPSTGMLADLLADLGLDRQAHAAVFRRADVLYNRHRGNVREVFRSLYDEIAVGPLGRLAAPTRPS